jgi:hypothetical protein
MAVKPAEFQRVVQSEVAAPTFGELFGQALARNVGRPIRQARQEKADFLKVAPTLAAQGLLGVTQGDDPNAVIKFGNVGLKPQTKPTTSADILNQAKTLEIFNKLGTQGTFDKEQLGKFFFDPTAGPAAQIQTSFADKLQKAQQEDAKLIKEGKTPFMEDQVRAEMAQELAKESNVFLSAFQKNPQAFVTSPQGQPQVLIQGKGGTVAPATPQQLAQGVNNLKLATPQQVQGNIFSAPAVRTQTAEAKTKKPTKLEQMLIDAGIVDETGQVTPTQAPPRQITKGDRVNAAAEIAQNTAGRVTGLAGEFARENPAITGLAGLGAFQQAVRPFLAGALPGGFPGQGLLAPKAPLSQLQNAFFRAGLRAPSLGTLARGLGGVGVGTAVGQQLGTEVGRLQDRFLPGLTGFVADPLRFINDPAFREFSLNTRTPEGVEQAPFLESLNPFNQARQELQATDFGKITPVLNAVR